MNLNKKWSNSHKAITVLLSRSSAPTATSAAKRLSSHAENVLTWVTANPNIRKLTGPPIAPSASVSLIRSRTTTSKSLESEQRFSNFSPTENILKPHKLPLNFLSRRKSSVKHRQLFIINLNMEPQLFYWLAHGFTTRISTRRWMYWMPTYNIRYHFWKALITLWFLLMDWLTIQKKSNWSRRSLIWYQQWHLFHMS